MLLLLLTGVLLLPDSSLTTAQETCSRLSPSIGSNNQTQLSNSESVGYFLNTNEPAHCSGTITSVDYCYYGPSRHNRRAWGAALALYRSDGDSGYSRVSDAIVLAKYEPSIVPSPDSVLQLNQFKCETHVLGQALTVKIGDIFGAFIVTDGALFGTVGGLDLVGDSNNGYQMLRALGNVNLSFEVTTTSPLNIRLPEEIDQLSVDSERRVLHVYANITRDSVPSSTDEPVTENETSDNGISSTSDQEISTQPPITIESLSRTPFINTTGDDMSSNDHEISTQLLPIVIKSSPSAQFIKITGGVIAGIVIIGIVICIATVTVILYRKKWQGASFDLTTNEAYAERRMHNAHHINEIYDTIQHSTCTSDVSHVNLPLEKNAAYTVKSPIRTARNVAYENSSEYYDYVD